MGSRAGRAILYTMMALIVVFAFSVSQVSSVEARSLGSEISRSAASANVHPKVKADGDVRETKESGKSKNKKATNKKPKDKKPPNKAPVTKPEEVAQPPVSAEPEPVKSTQSSEQSCEECANGGASEGGDGGRAAGGTATGGDGGVAIGGGGGLATPGQAGSGGAANGGEGVVAGSDGSQGSGEDGSVVGGNGGQAVGGEGAEAASDTEAGGGDAGSLGGSVLQGTSQVLQAVSGGGSVTYEELFNTILDPESRTVIFEQIGRAVCVRCGSGGTAEGGNGGTATGGTATGGDGGTAIGGDGSGDGLGGVATGGEGGDASADASADGGDASANSGAGLVAQAIKQVQQPVAAMIPEWATTVVFRQVAQNVCYYCSVGGNAEGGNGGTATGGTATGGDGGTAIGGDGSGDGLGGVATGGEGGDASADASADGGDASANGGAVYQLIEQVQNPLIEIPAWVGKVVYRQVATNTCYYCSVGGNAEGGDGGTATGGTSTGGDEGAEIPGDGEEPLPLASESVTEEESGDASGNASADASADGGDAVAAGGIVYQRAVQTQIHHPSQGTAGDTATPGPEVVYIQNAENYCNYCAPGGIATGGSGGQAIGGTATGGDANDGVEGSESSDAVADGGTASAGGGRVTQIVVQTQPPEAPTAVTHPQNHQQIVEQTCVECQTPGTATSGEAGTVTGNDTPPATVPQQRIAATSISSEPQAIEPQTPDYYSEPISEPDYVPEETPGADTYETTPPETEVSEQETPETVATTDETESANETGEEVPAG